MSTNPIFVTVTFDDGTGYQQRSFAVPDVAFHTPVKNTLDDGQGNPGKHLAWRAGMLVDIFREYGLAHFDKDPKEATHRVPVLSVPLNAPERP